MGTMSPDRVEVFMSDRRVNAHFFQEKEER